MNRRKLLVGLTSVSTSLIAGCTDFSTGDESVTETSSTPTEQSTQTEENTVGKKVEQYWINTGKHLRQYDGHTFVVDYTRTKDGEIDEEIDYELRHDSVNRRVLRISDSSTKGLSITFGDETGTYLKEVSLEGEESYEVRSEFTFSGFTYMYITEHFLGYLYASDYSNAVINDSEPSIVISVTGPENVLRERLNTRFTVTQEQITGYKWEQITDDTGTWFKQLNARLETDTGYIVESHGEFTDIGETTIEEPEWVTELKNQETTTESK